MALKCLIADDDPVVCNLIEDYCNRLDQVEYLLKVHNGDDALTLLTSQSFDLLFLDLNLPGADGREILEFIPPDLPVIMITSDKSFALEAWEFNVIAFLLKPVKFPAFLKAIQKVSVTAPDDDHFFVKEGSKLVKIMTNEIDFIKSESNYVHFMIKGKKIMSLMKMSDLEEQLPDHFLRVHRSYIVNLRSIAQVESSFLMVAGQEIPMSEKNRAGLMEKIRLLN